MGICGPCLLPGIIGRRSITSLPFPLFSATTTPKLFNRAINSRYLSGLVLGMTEFLNIESWSIYISLVGFCLIGGRITNLSFLTPEFFPDFWRGRFKEVRRVVVFYGILYMGFYQVENILLT